MEPYLSAGNVVLSWKWFTPKVGDVVVVNRGRPLIKRVTDIRRGEVWLEGDNKEASNDSRRFGYVPLSDVEAKIIKHLF